MQQSNNIRYKSTMTGNSYCRTTTLVLDIYFADNFFDLNIALNVGLQCGIITFTEVNDMNIFL